MGDLPLVSVVIPVYNGERYLAESIGSALAQTYRPIEIVVVDDGSTDHSAEIARGFGSSVRYVAQSRAGAGAARNRGADLAEGNFLAFLDADDLWLKDKLKRQMAVLSENSDLDMILTHVRQFHSPELADAVKAKIARAGEMFAGYLAGTLLIRRESFFRAGRFATHWHVGEFVDWYAKATERGLKSFMLPEVLMERRLHTDNSVIRERDSQKDYLRIVKASLDRRRGRL